MKEIRLEKKDGIARMSEDFGLVVDLLRNGRYTVTIKQDRQASKAQSALLWMWLNAASRETGDAPSDLYKYYCRKLLSKRITVMGHDVEVSETTKDLTREQMTSFLNRLRDDMYYVEGIRLPMPEDRAFEQFREKYG